MDEHFKMINEWLVVLVQDRKEVGNTQGLVTSDLNGVARTILIVSGSMFQHYRFHRCGQPLPLCSQLEQNERKWRSLSQ